MSDIHPLDRDDDDPISGSSSSPTANTASPLRPVVIGTVIIGSLVMITSIWMNNVGYGSFSYQTAFVVNRILMVLLLGTFLGMLIYFQRKNLAKILERLQSTPTPPNLIQAESLEATGNAFESNITSTANSPVIPNQGPSVMNSTRATLYPMFVLVGANLLLLVVIWCISMLLAGLPMPWMTMLFSSTLTLLPGLLICMIIWNRGMMRAYAVGLLTTHVTSGLGFLAMLGPMGMRYGNNYYGYNSGGGFDFSWTLAAHWTLVVFGGIVPACYVAILTYYRSKQKQSS